MRRLRTTLLLSSALIPFGALPAVANPLGGNVVAGDASIAGESTPTVTVTQSSDKAIIDWRSFDIAPSETTQFVLPSQQSVTLNRVTGGEGASTIAGTLSANGQVFLINPDGILFSKDARIDVGGLLATTNDIANADFMAGSYRFSVPGNPRASIVNDGAISISDTGIAALVAPGVRNAGTIAANLGKISLASGNDFTLDFYGDHLISLAVDDTVAGQIIDVGTGKPLTDLVSNSGLLKADGGTVQLTASAARNIVDSVINNTGTIEADTVGMKNGRIVLSAATAKSKPSGAPIQTVKVSGSLSASGKNPGETGGAVEITGEAIALTVATIDAYGWNGGGKVLAGGDYRGGNVAPGVIEQYGTSLEPYSIPTASYVIADPDTQISVDALHEGKGGKVILWSDLATVTAATITARGGGEAGDGGFVETSGEYLSALTPVDASAANGVGGTWLLDPLDVHLRAGASGNYTSSFATIFDPAHPVPQFYTISVPGVYDTTVTAINALPTGSPSYIDTNDIDSALNGGSNVRITTRGTGGSAPGDIYVDSSIIRSSGTGTRYLNLDSAHDIIVAPGVSIGSYTDPMHILLDAHDGAINAPSMGAVGTEGGVLRLDASRGVTFHAASHMPGIFGLEINRDPPPSSQRVDVDVSFINDVIRFYYVGGVAYVLGGGVQLSDGSYSSFELRTHGLDGVLYDNAVNIRSGRGIAIVPDPGYNYGAAASDDFDGIPEFVSGTPISFSLGNEPTSTAVVPVLEVSDYGSPGIRYVPTAPSGQRLISEHLASLVSSAALATANSTEFVSGASTAAAQEPNEFPAPANSTSPYGPIRPPSVNLWAKQLDNHDAAPALLSYALLANAIQNGETSYDQAGWTPLQSWADILRQNSSNPNIESIIEKIRSSGFSAATYQKDGLTVLAFAGTDPNQIVDWVTDGQQLFGQRTDNQYEFALALSLYLLKGVRSSDVRLVGYSLGGGLAQYVASELQFRAITFNAAGLGGLASFGMTSTSVINVRSTSDPISAHSGNQLGNITYEFNSSSGHSMDGLISAIRAAA